MADALNIATLEIRRSIDPAGLDRAAWIVWSLKAAEGRLPTADETRVLAEVPRKYWRIVADALAEMDAAGKAVVDAVAATAAQAEVDRQADLDRVRTRGAAIRTEIAAIKAVTPATVAQVNTRTARMCDVMDDLARAVFRLAERSQ